MNIPEKQTLITFEGLQVVNVDFNSVPIELNQFEYKYPKVSINYKVIEDVSKKDFFGIKFNAKINDSGNIFNLTISAIGKFNVTNPIDESFLSSDFAIINAPAIAFPYFRSMVTNITVNFGFPPLILPTYNFTKTKNQNN